MNKGLKIISDIFQSAMLEMELSLVLFAISRIWLIISVLLLFVMPSISTDGDDAKWHFDLNWRHLVTKYSNYFYNE
jgi:hypothetical protein